VQCLNSGSILDNRERERGHCPSYQLILKKEKALNLEHMQRLQNTWRRKHIHAIMIHAKASKKSAKIKIAKREKRDHQHI
jgi:hypothetical protein